MTMRGTLLKGPSHEDGGIPGRIKETNQPIEVEGDEMIINKRSTRIKQHIVCKGTGEGIGSALNELGGGKKWSDEGSCQITETTEQFKKGNKMPKNIGPSEVEFSATKVLTDSEIEKIKKAGLHYDNDGFSISIMSDSGLTEDQLKSKVEKIVGEKIKFYKPREEFSKGNKMPKTTKEIKDRLEYLRGELRKEKISFEELAELQSLREYIEPGDVELLEAAGVAEFAKGKLIPKLENAVVFDNGGETLDRYTILIKPTGEVLGASENPFHGFGQHVGNVTDRMNITFGYGWRRGQDEKGIKRIIKSEVENYINEAKKEGHLGKEVKDLNSLPEGVKKFIMQEQETEEFADGAKIKKGDRELFEKIKSGGPITENEVNLIKNRMNNNRQSDLDKEMVQYIWDNPVSLTDEQNQKRIDFLKKLWKTPAGKERLNNPFGSREEEALENFKNFELAGFHDIATYGGRSFYVPIYNVIAKDGYGFQYYYDRNGVNIIGKRGMKINSHINKTRNERNEEIQRMIIRDGQLKRKMEYGDRVELNREDKLIKINKPQDFAIVSFLKNGGYPSGLKVFKHDSICIYKSDPELIEFLNKYKIAYSEFDNYEEFYEWFTNKLTASTKNKL